MGQFRNLINAELAKKSVSDKFNILSHQVAIHADHCHGQGVGEKLLLDSYSVRDDFDDPTLRRFVDYIET